MRRRFLLAAAIAPQRQVYVPERLGGTFVFTLATGAFAYAAGRAPCASPAGPFSTTFHP